MLQSLIESAFTTDENASGNRTHANRLARLFAQHKGLYPALLLLMLAEHFSMSIAERDGGRTRSRTLSPGVLSLALSMTLTCLLLPGKRRRRTSRLCYRKTALSRFHFPRRHLSVSILVLCPTVSRKVTGRDSFASVSACYALVAQCPLRSETITVSASTPAFTAYNDQFVQAMRRAGHLLQQHTTECLLGPVELLSSWLQNAGFHQVQGEQVMVPFGAGTPAHQACYDLLTTEMERFRPLLLQDSAMSEEDLRQLEKQAQEAMREPTFDGVLCLQQVWASKRQAEPERVAHAAVTEAMEMAV